jgi:predicted acetyltransferase
VSQPEIVNPVSVDDADPWLRTFMTTMLGDPHQDEFPKRLDRWVRAWDPDRTWGVRDRGRWVATLATEERTLTVPGTGTTTNDIPADAVTAVTVAATHRRRGLLTRMLSDSLQAAKDRGDAVSVLLAAEWPIYGRYGYAPATITANYRYHLRRPGAKIAPGDPSRVRQAEPDELGEIAPAVFDAARRLRAGQVDRRSPWWDRRLALDGYEMVSDARLNWFVHDGPDGADGLLSWKVSRDFELNGLLGAVEVSDLIAANDEAYQDFWAYLGGIDVIDEIELHDRPVDEPIRWLLGDGRALQQTEAVDFLWVRLLDVPAALSARGYAIEGRVVLDVVDLDTGSYGAGRVALTAGAHGTKCEPTDEPADLQISQRALASIYLGGHRLRQRDIMRDVTELTPGARDRVDVMFATSLAPWTQTGF